MSQSILEVLIAIGFGIWVGRLQLDVNRLKQWKEEIYTEFEVSSKPPNGAT